jgi:hypothetical protein
MYDKFSQSKEHICRSFLITPGVSDTGLGTTGVVCWSRNRSELENTKQTTEKLWEVYLRKSNQNQIAAEFRQAGFLCGILGE